MDDAMIVRVLESRSDLLDDVHRKSQACGQVEPVRRGAADGVGERAVRRVLHHQIEIAVFKATIMYRQNVRMGELAEQLALTHETRFKIRIGVLTRRDSLLGA